MEPITVTIERLNAEDFTRVADWLSKPTVNQWLTSEWRGRIILGQWIALLVRNPKNRAFLVRCNREPCGFAALADIDAIDRTAMVWYALGETAFSGRGVMSEALRQLTRYSFRELRLSSLYAWIMLDNAASERVLVKAGFRRAGCIRHAAVSNGFQVDRVYYDIIAEECR